MLCGPKRYPPEHSPELSAVRYDTQIQAVKTAGLAGGLL